MTPPCERNPSTTTKTDVGVRTHRPEERPPVLVRVDTTLELLGGVVDDLFAIGLSLRTDTWSDGIRSRNDSESILGQLDGIIGRIRQFALASTRPVPRVQRPEWLEVSGLPTDELTTIELLDAAHSATRALIGVQGAGAP